MTNPPLLDGPRLPPASGGRPGALVVLLHGYGSNGQDMIGLAPQWRAALPDAAFVAPNAPLRLAEVPGGYQWWPLASIVPAALALGAASAAGALDRFLDAELAATGVAAERLVLAGFSQGTMVALHVGLRRAERIGAIVGYSGALADVGDLARQIRTRPPVLLVHGDSDDVVPVAALAHAAAGLRAVDVEVETRVAPGLAHGVDMAGIMAGAAFAKAALAGR